MTTPHPNRGVPDGGPPSVTYSAGLDWLRFSVPDWHDFQAWLARAGVVAGCEEAIRPIVREDALTPLAHYNSALEYTTFRVDWHTERPAQKILVTFSGADLAEWRARGGNDLSLLRTVKAISSAHITRLDFAIDVRGQHIDVEDIYIALDEGKCSTSARARTLVESYVGAIKGKTVYVGSRTSGRVLRVYDKGAERGETQNVWTRIELESKSPMAGALAESMARYGIAQAGRKALGKFLACEIDWYAQAISENADFEIPRPGRKSTSFEKWALNFLLPQCNKAVRTVPGFAEALSDLIEAAKRGGGHGA